MSIHSPLPFSFLFLEASPTPPPLCSLYKSNKRIANHFLDPISKQTEQATDSLKSTVGLNASKAEGEAKELTGEAKGKASELAGEAKGKGQEVAGQAKGKAEEIKGKL